MRPVIHSFLILASFTPVGCEAENDLEISPVFSEIVGQYSFHPFGHEILTLKENKEFLIELSNDLLENRVSKGTWNLNDKKLIELKFEGDGHTTHYRYAKIEGKLGLVWEERYQKFLKIENATYDRLIFGEKLPSTLDPQAPLNNTSEQDGSGNPDKPDFRP